MKDSADPLVNVSLSNKIILEKRSGEIKYGSRRIIRSSREREKTSTCSRIRTVQNNLGSLRKLVV